MKLNWRRIKFPNCVSGAISLSFAQSLILNVMTSYRLFHPCVNCVLTVDPVNVRSLRFDVFIQAYYSLTTLHKCPLAMHCLFACVSISNSVSSNLEPLKLELRNLLSVVYTAGWFPTPHSSVSLSSWKKVYSTLCRPSSTLIYLLIYNISATPTCRKETLAEVLHLWERRMPEGRAF